MKREGLISEFPVEDVAVMEVAELLPYLVRILVRLLLVLVFTDSIFCGSPWVLSKILWS
jgi:hypothetical protein